MKYSSPATAFVASLLTLLSPSAAVNPVQKVIQLISDLEVKIIAEGQSAQKVYEEFAEWCEDRSKNVGFEIKTGKSEVASLQATIEASTSDAASARAKIEELTSGIATDEADLKAATDIRKKEKTDFATAEKDLVETINMLQRAIGILEREMRKGGASMMQLKQASSFSQVLRVMVDASMLGWQDAKRLTALVQSNQADEDGDADLGAPSVASYKGHSGDIIDTLEGLTDKAKDQLDSARSKETSASHNFEMLKQSLQDEIKFGNKDLAETKKALAAAGEAKANAEGDLAETSKGLKEDQETLASLHQKCMTKSQDFEAETKSRGEELKALAGAKKAITEATSGAEQVAYGLDQTSFFQTDKNSHRNSLKSQADLANFEAVRLVRDLARREHSEALAQLAMRMAAVIHSGSNTGDDPFAKIKSLIKDMIERLLKEGESEASHKAYCDKEMGETAAKQEDQQAQIDKLTATIDSASAKSATLKEDVAVLQKALADIAASQSASNKIRSEERAIFSKNEAETKEGLEGVKVALKILREYYAADAAHSAAEGAGTGIIGMLEVVESDFSKSLAEMTVAEQTAVRDYDEQTKQNAISKATKEQSVKYKTREFKELDQTLSEATSDRSAVQAELAAILEYNAKLNAMCVAKPSSYSERSARRQAEIDGLKEALEILRGEAVLLQRRYALRGNRRLAP